MITVHHLNNSRSQRILWLLEELGLPYEVKRYQRDPKTNLAPPELKAINPLGKSPVIEDGALVLIESAAIIDYLIRRHGQKGKVIWFTGLSGSGKSTLANALELELHAKGYRTYILDGDNVRQGLNRDLGFTDADRVENIRRIAEVAKLMMDAGLIVLTAFISPFRREREMAKELIGEDRFVEVYVSTTLEVCEERDVKGLYKKARSGQLPNLSGVGSPYEAPDHTALNIDAANTDLKCAVDKLMTHIK